jgi:hypothetical protein
MGKALETVHLKSNKLFEIIDPVSPDDQHCLPRETLRLDQAQGGVVPIFCSFWNHAYESPFSWVPRDMAPRRHSLIPYIADVVCRCMRVRTMYSGVLAKLGRGSTLRSNNRLHRLLGIL